MRENQYQRELIERIERLLPGALVLKNNPDHIQGIPDLLVLYADRWGALEVKTSKNAGTRPNQRHYVDLMDVMAFAAFIYPSNEKEVLDALYKSLTSSG